MKLTILISLIALLTSCGSMNYSMDAAEATIRSDSKAYVNSKAYPATKLQAVPTAKAQPAVPGRVLIYTAEVRILTSDLIAASDTIVEMSREKGGYLIYSDGKKIIVRVPAKQLNSFMDNLSKAGKITGSRIQADDVTDRLFDLETRLKNAAKLRERYMKLVEKAGKLEDTLKIEKELARVTGEIEKLKGILKKMKESISYSKVTILLNSPEPVKEVTALPFRWIQGLARDLRNPRLPSPYKGSIFNKGLNVEYPEGFAGFYEYNELNWATDGNGSFMKSRVIETAVDAKPIFWKNAVSNFLQKSRLIVIVEIKNVETESGKGFIIKGKFGNGNRQMDYHLLVVTSEDKILTSEVWGNSQKLANKEIEGILKKADVSL